MKDPEKAHCRGCRRELDGAWNAVQAYVPARPGVASWNRTEARRNYYGGWVCSRECDYRAALELYQDMPGCGTAQKPERAALEKIERNWSTP